MKKLFSILLVLSLLILCLASCGGDEIKKNENAASSGAQSEEGGTDSGAQSGTETGNENEDTPEKDSGITLPEIKV